jgi:hypothetical protein
MTEKLSRPDLESKWAVWNLPTFEGLPSEDPQAWLTKVDSDCQTLGIPISQRMLTAIHFLRGSLQVVMKKVKRNLESQQELPSCIEKWDAFKTAINGLHGDSDCCLLCLDHNENILSPGRRVNTGMLVVSTS